ncbi:N-acetylglucosamine 6-phosphate deacetylase [Arthrobacter sp. RIT-PI-e]|uniref:N-acetylglucosamine-6-phosphate deacetylase n=1 Tax=Arthrobacter sp. RIT-PI-e TaxID=1681197 RepID=UPI00067692C5|nr:amidohydrolase family protein [Arthrobacter sp. RIT-PI-e]KNC18814.1 N-acetylglucosamine 6-phosphate deacetylase [Arthrobacter sp. RIT-PI-e]
MAHERTTPTALYGRLVSESVTFDHGVLSWQDGRITAAGPADGAVEASAVRLPEDFLILPGLVDLHCHGGGGGDFTSGSPEEIRRAARFLHGRGSTTVLASTCAAPVHELEAAFGRLADEVDDGLLAGIHAEGPYLSPERSGAHDPAHLLLPDHEDTIRLLAAARGQLTSMTYAPELPGSDALVYDLVMHGVIPSIGHTDASTEQTTAALDLICEELASTGFVGFSGRPTATHLFNAMPPLHHRVPGPVPLLLQRARLGEIAVELVADGVHLHPETVRMAFTIAGAENICLVSDATAAAGCASGSYRLGGREVTVVGGTAVLADTGALAGGAGTLVDVVRSTVRAGVAVEDAVRAASSVPAAVLGLADEVGGLRAGLRADAVVVSPDFEVRGVLRQGTWILPLDEDLAG